jgi:hypothetical protein
MKGKKPERVAKKTKPCPKCGSHDVVPIVYGYPSSEMEREADKGLIELGGCCVLNDDPQKYCKACGERFDPPKRPLSARRGA